MIVHDLYAYVYIINNLMVLWWTLTWVH